MTEVKKWGTSLWISREQALEYGLLEPTPEERAQQDANRARYAADREAERAQWLEALPQLAAVGSVGVLGNTLLIADPVSRLVLDLHSIDSALGQGRCVGCDWSGYEGEPPEWPCRTVRLVARHHGITLPDGPMPSLEDAKSG